MTLPTSSSNPGDLQRQQYGAYYKKWLLFCCEREIDQYKPFVNNVIAFLTKLHQQGVGYSALNTAKSVCLFVLRFYGPVNPMGSCRARSVYLTTRLLGRLSPLSS